MPWYPGNTSLDSARECVERVAEAAVGVIAALRAGDVDRAAHIEAERMPIWRHRRLEHLFKIRAIMLCHMIGHTAPDCPKPHQAQSSRREQRLQTALDPRERR